MASCTEALFCPSGLPSSASFSGSLRLACGSWRKACRLRPLYCPISQMRFIKHTTARHRLLSNCAMPVVAARVHVFKQGAQRQSLASALAFSPPNNDDKPGGKRAALALCALPAASKTRGTF